MEQALKTESASECQADLPRTVPKPGDLRHQVGDVNLEFLQMREAEKGGPSIHQSEDDLKGPTDDADFNVSLQSAEEEKRDLAGSCQSESKSMRTLQHE